jgi:site-specific DNA-methyltransferase (adenine-specific)
MAVINIIHGDCMESMKAMPDKAYDLAIVDPPYGIGNFIPQHNSYGGTPGKNVCWNDSTPDSDYFTQLRRVSRNRIVWGANYYNCFEPRKGAIVWYKGDQQEKFSHCEIAAHTFYKKVDFIHINWQSGFFRASQETVIHPCQKPVRLYEWLLKNYAKPGDKILDTHGGSCSIAIACDIMGFDLDCYEIDLDYWTAATERFQRHKRQEVLPL